MQTDPITIEALEGVSMSDDRGIAYREGDTSVYRASGLGSCIQALAASMAGYEPARSEYAQTILDNAAKEGNLHEGAIINDLRDQGYKIGGAQQIVEMQIIPRVIVRGHTDGIGRVPRGRKDRVFEAKTMSKTRFKKWQSFDGFEAALLSPDFLRYGWQISVYMHALDMEAIYAVKNRDSGEVLVDILETPPIDLKTIRKKVIAVEKWRPRDELPPCDVESSEKFFCPYPYLHEDFAGEEDEDGYSPVESVDDTLLVGMAEHHEKLTAVIKRGKQANEERKDVNKRIVGVLGDRKTVEVGAFRITKQRGMTGAKLSVEDLAGELDMPAEKLQELVDKHSTQREYFFPRVTRREK